MNENEIKELIFSLAWFPFSSYHNQNVFNILKNNFPGVHFTDALNEYEKIYLSKSQQGSPK